RATTMDLERLYDVRVVARDDVRAAIDREAGFRPVLGGRLPLVWNAPVKRDDDPINQLAEPTDIRLECFERIHCASRQPPRGGATSVPVVAEKTTSPLARPSNSRHVGSALVDTGPHHLDARQRQRIQRLENTRPAAIEQVVVGQCQHVYPDSLQRKADV